MKTKQKHLQDLFASFDEDGDGKLQYDELSGFLGEVMQGLTEPELRYFMVSC